MDEEEQMSVPVSERALVQRINRRLHANAKIDAAGHVHGQWHCLKKTRGARAVQELGEYYLLDVYRNAVLQHHVDPAKLAKQLEVLRPYEQLGAPVSL
jgi:hypothetical protein